MARDIQARETGAAVTAGFVVTVMVLAVFLAAIEVVGGARQAQVRRKP